jgi:hypothetical protein
MTFNKILLTLTCSFLSFSSCGEGESWQATKEMESEEVM